MISLEMKIGVNLGSNSVLKLCWILEHFLLNFKIFLDLTEYLYFLGIYFQLEKDEKLWLKEGLGLEVIEDFEN